MKDEVIKYAEEMTSGESTVLQELRAHCYAHYEDHAMLSGFFQGRVLSMLSHMIRPKVVLEIGTYLGYSALCLAEGLADGGKVITLDVQEDTNAVALSFVEKTEYKYCIDFHLGNAADITNPAYGVNYFDGKWAIDFLAKSTNADIHNVGVRLEMNIPNLFRKSLTRNGISSVEHEEVQERKFIWRQADIATRASHGMAHQIESKIGKVKGGFGGVTSP